MTRVFNKNVFSSLKFGALTSDDVTITNSSSQITNNEEDLTITCDVKFNVFGDYYVFAIPATVGANRVYIYAQVNNTIGVNIGAGGMGTSSTGLQPGVWYSLVLLLDRANSRGRFFVNGVQTKPWTAVTFGTGTTDITFANVGSSAVKSLIGNACNYRMWNRVLSDSEIQNLYFKKIVPSNSLIGEWLLGEGAGTIAYDSSGRGNNGTISGAVWSSDTPSKTRLNINNNLVKNGSLDFIPVVNTGPTTSARWYDGSAAGSTTNDVFNWYVITGVGTTSYTFDTSTRSPLGSPSLKIDCDATGRGRFCTAPFETTTTAELVKQYGIKVEPNTTYTLTFYIKTISTINARIDVTPFNSLGLALTLSSSTSVVGTNDWTLQSLTFATTAATSYVMLRPILVTAGNAQTVWFADIKILPANPVKRQVDTDIVISANGQATSPNPSIDTVTSNAGTAIGWFKVNSYGGQTLFGFYDSTATLDAWRFSIEVNTGYPFIWSVNTTPTGTAVIKPSIPIPLNKWFHIAAVQTIANGDVTAKIYINGNLWGTGVRSGSNVRSNARFSITNTGTQRYTKIAAYERELTQTEILGHYQKDITPVGAKIKYDVQEGAGDILYDSSGNSANGTLGTLTWFSDSPTGMRKSVNENLVKNGDFSVVPVVNVPTTSSGRWIDGTALGSTTNDIFKYSLFSTSGTVSSVFDTTNLYLGKPSLKVSTLAISSFAEVCTSINGYNPATIPFTNTIYLKPSTSYTIRYAMKTVLNSGSTSGGAMISVHENNGSGTRLAQTATITAVNTTTDWTVYSATFTTNAATTRAELRLQVYGHLGTGTAIMDAWFADVVLTPTTPTSRTAA